MLAVGSPLSSSIPAPPRRSLSPLLIPLTKEARFKMKDGEMKFKKVGIINKEDGVDVVTGINACAQPRLNRSRLSSSTTAWSSSRVSYGGGGGHKNRSFITQRNLGEITSRPVLHINLVVKYSEDVRILGKVGPKVS